MDNAFYFILKALFVLKILKFCSDFFDHVGKWLDNKAKVNLWRHKLDNKQLP